MNIRNLAAVVALGTVTAMAAMVPAWAGTITGTVAYRERIAVPPDAVLEVSLLDVSRADAASVRLASKRIAMDRVPFPFALDYDDAMIDDRMSYTLEAVIHSGGRQIYRTTTAHPVLTRGGSESVDIVVERLSDHTATAVPEGAWQVSEIAGRVLIADRAPDIEFKSDGSFGGSTGCNRYRGTAQPTAANGLSFPDNIAATLMACPPPYDKLERDFFTALDQVAGFVQAGDQLSFVNSAGIAVMRLSRVD